MTAVIIDITNMGNVSFTSSQEPDWLFCFMVQDQKLTLLHNTPDVSTEGSTLYRIEFGATFDGSGSSGTTMMASGTKPFNNSAWSDRGGEPFDSGSLNRWSITGTGTTRIQVEGERMEVITKDAR